MTFRKGFRSRFEETWLRRLKSLLRGEDMAVLKAGRRPGLHVFRGVTMALVLAVAAGALGADYYVDIQNGSNNTGDGTQGNPWRTITFSLLQISGTGHTLHIAPGTYDTTPGPEGWFEIFPIVVEDGVSMIGDQGADSTILDAQRTNGVMTATSIAAGTVIRGLTLQNGSSSAGGGIVIRNSFVALTECAVKNNRAGTGGGIHIDGEAPSVVDCLISDNVANNAASGGGGGIDAYRSSPIITGNTITGNRAGPDITMGGGGVYIRDCPGGSITGNLIKANAATYDSMFGGSYGGGLLLRNSPVVVSDNTIEANATERGGGGIDCSGRPVLLRNTITYNEAAGISGSGGGQVANNIVMCNETDGVHYNSAGARQISNNIIAGNGRHGISLTRNTSLTVVNNIIARNVGIAIHEYTTDADAAAAFNLFYDNAGGVFRDENQSTYNSILQLETFVPECSDNLEGDPLFVDETNGNYHLSTSSICIDAGTPTGAPPDDMDGEPRPNGSGIDIGADEYYGPHPADTNANYYIENFEMLRWVDLWAAATVTQPELDLVRVLWRSKTGYRSDGAGSYEPR